MISEFQSILCVSVFQGSLLVIIIMIDGSEKRSTIVKAAFESKALVHVIWCHQGEKGTHLPS